MIRGLVISHAYNFKKLTDYKTSHRANIFSAKFLPNSGDRNIVSCSGDGIILFTDLTRAADTHQNQFTCHTGTSYDVATVAGEPHTFLSCGEDSTVRCFDLRRKESCNKMDCTENQSCTTLEPSIGGGDDDEEVDDDLEAGPGAVGGGKSDAGAGAAGPSLPPIRRLRLRGDWSDTGPDARPEREPGCSDVGQARPTLHATLMQRMTDVLSRMLNDPATRAALSHGGEEDSPTTGVAGGGGPEVDVGAGGEELMMEGGSAAVDADNSLASPARSQLSEGDVSQNEPDCFDCSVASSTSAAAAAAAPVINVDDPSPSTSSSSVPPSAPAPPPPSSASAAQQTEGAGSSSGSSSDQESLSCLTDQLFSMRHGFIEKHGTEPMVNLHYSEKGSTASRITMTVGDEINREAVASTSTAPSTAPSATPEAAPSTSNHDCQDVETASPPSAPAEQSTSKKPYVAGPSNAVASANKPPEPMSEEDDFNLNSDDETDLPSVILLKGSSAS
ncbi:hypothetical protein LSTR_LSTR015410 [Laodelphax striatellus]|uniref:Uncharacterized protein n=1 Tax=Laodelphax striatellus TaxID=195883 RepID=A0A482WQS0_LAOST|nr:hypothetical protein LSTR_LSTR015410 [Laodelphax striatellus]